MRSIEMPSLNHQTESLERLKRPLGLAKGRPLSERMAAGSPRSANRRSKAEMTGFSRVEFESLAEQQEARGVIGDGEGVAIASVTELELTFEVGAPEIVGVRP